MGERTDRGSNCMNKEMDFGTLIEIKITFPWNGPVSIF
jgi:hypothetical protein